MRAEEAQLTGAVLDLCVLVVLGTDLDTACDEPEVGARQQCQATTEEHCGHTGPLDAPAGEVGADRVDDASDEEERGQELKDPGFDFHPLAPIVQLAIVVLSASPRSLGVSPLVLRRVSNGTVVTDVGCWHTDSSAWPVVQSGFLIRAWI